MTLSHEFRSRKIREIAERHGWTIKRTEEQISSFRFRLNIPEEELLEILLQMKPDLLQQPS